jgi:RND superfamily putative drug exporter
MLESLASLIARRPRRVVLVAVLAAVTAALLGAGVADRLDPYGADDPSSESVHADERLEQASGLSPEVGLVALVDLPGPIRSPQSRARVERVKEIVSADPAVGRLRTWFDGAPAMLSRDGRATYVAAEFKRDGDKALQEAAERIEHRLEGVPGVKVGGIALAQAQVNAQVEHDLVRAELLAFPLLFLLSLLFFRGLVAAMLPLLVGGLAVVGTFLVLRLMSEAMSVSVFALNLTTALGLGLAIDYSLFVVSRYREELAKHGPGREALVRTLTTAGRTVLFSSLTVAAALASLLVFPQRFLYSMGLGGAAVAIVAGVVALTVLPAVLALLGERVNALSPSWLRRARELDGRPDHEGGWYRLSRFVMRRPARVAIVTGALLIALGVPFLRIDFVTVDPTVLPADASARQVYDRVQEEFPPNRTTPITVVAESAPAGELREYARRLGELPGAAGSTPPRPAELPGAAGSTAPRPAGLPGAAGSTPPRPAGDGAWVIDVIPAEEPTTAASEDLLRAVRGEPAPARALATGQTAEFADMKESLVAHLPLAFAIVVAATMVLLFLMTGSVVLPLKALVMNVLNLSAAFGLLVLIFQDGRLEGFLDYTSQGGLEATMPILLFAIAFGLSTDYGVFLLSRIKEARDAGASDSESVAIGLERTGRIVTAAAALFSVAMLAFATSEIIFIKENGIGTALAVIIDATIVRALLVPALMELLGRRNWWAPRPLRRLYDRAGLREDTAPSGA